MTKHRDEETEMALLGCLILKPDIIPMIAGDLKANEFANDYHRRLYTALLVMYEANEPVGDLLAVRGKVIAMGIGWDTAYMGRIASSVPTANNAKHYAATIRELATRRRVIELSTVLLRRANDPTSQLTDIASHAREYLDVLERQSTKDTARPIGDVMSDVVAEFDQPACGGGVPTGFPSIDSKFGRMQGSELTIVGARPGGGKTTFSIQVAHHNASMGRRVLYVSLEMGELQFAKRLACLETGIDPRLLRDGDCPPEERAAIAQLATDMQEAETPFLLWAPPRATHRDIEARARYEHACGGLDLLIVDHTQLVRDTDSAMPRYQQLGRFTKCFKAIAKELKIPVIAQCQLARSEDRPVLSSLRESGDIEQNGDNVWFLHRDENEPNQREYIVAKFRNGPIGSTKLSFTDGRFQDFAVAGKYKEFP